MSAAVGQGELVEAGGQCPPLLEGVERALDDVVALVRLDVECGRSSAGLAASFAV